MERDFLGLGLESVPFTIKEETTDHVSKDLVPMKGSAVQWSFSNKVSAIPQFLSFNSGVEEKPRKTIHDPLSSSGFNPISAADASTKKPFSSMVQKNMSVDRQGTNHYATTTYSVLQPPQQVRIFPLSNQQNQTSTVSMSSPVLQSNLASNGRNVISNAMNLQSIGGVPIISPVSVHPTPSSIVGTTELRNESKSTGTPAPLTIFYAGSVCVYDDISPEKAQAIMLLAGNGSSATHNKTLSTAQMQAPIIRPSSCDGYVGNRARTISPCTGLPSPISVTSSSTNELATMKSLGALASGSYQTEPPKTVTSAAPGSATLFPAVAVPQARKASLARFLEKRKERVTYTSPYSVSKKSPDCPAIVAENVSLSINSFSSQSHQLAVKGPSD